MEARELVRDGLFSAASRTYAEQYIEPLIREKFNLLEPSGDDYDAGDREGNRYEIKASKVMRRRNNRKASKTIMERNPKNRNIRSTCSTKSSLFRYLS